MKTIQPKGTLIPIGGGEDKEDKKEILCRIVGETGKRKPKICVITLATNMAEEVASGNKKAYAALGIPDVVVIHYEVRAEAMEGDHLEKIKHCDAVLFSGGDQLKLTSLLGGTELLSLIKDRYYEETHFVVAGTSAGAAAMSDTMIVSGSSRDAMVNGELGLTNGLDFLNNVFIETHFTERGRFGRSIHTITCNPSVLGIGLGEDTAIVIKDGHELEVIGSGLVVVMDGTTIDYTDLMEKEDGEPVTVQGVKLHILGPGKRFSLIDRKLTLVKDKAKKEKTGA